MQSRFKVWWILVLTAGLVLGAERGPRYVEEIQQYRESRETRLRGEYGWLSLVGLFWLERGENPFGTDPAHPIVFPEGSSPATAGSFYYDGETVRLRAAPGSRITVDDEPVTDRKLQTDADGSPDRLRLGRLEFYVLARGGRHGVRVKDPESPSRLEFVGLEFFPVDPDARVHATFKPIDRPREIEVPTVTGTPAKMFAPGMLEFSLGSDELSLMPLVDAATDRDLFIIFRDPTNGHETYGAGRYLSAELGEDGAILDFNRAYNPPCAFTPFATCPLAPRENRLGTRVEAGERYSGH